MNILIIGAYPPSIGGISVHIKRLYDSLQDLGHKAEVYDFGGTHTPQKSDGVFSSFFKIAPRLLSYRRETHPDTLLHIHVSAMGKFRWIGPILISLFRNYPMVLTIHSGSFVTNIKKGGNTGYIRWLLSAFDEVISVSQEQKDYLLELGISDQQVAVIPAYIYQKPISETLPAEINELMGEKEILVLTSGYLTPLYNYDVLISAIEKLPADQYGFIFAVYNQYDPMYEKHILGRLSDLDNIVLVRDLRPETYLDLVDKCHVYVRTTLTDGDSVAIREAMMLGKTVFATDVVQRPYPCQLFSATDPESLFELFNNKELISSGLEVIEESDGIEPILQVYRKAHAHFQSKR